MATYVMLNIIFLVVALGVLWVTRALAWTRASAATLLVLVVCTAVFDSLIIVADIVRYDPALNLGVMIGAAPIEDFFYALMAVVVVPSVWHYTRPKEARNDQ